MVVYDPKHLFTISMKFWSLYSINLYISELFYINTVELGTLKVDVLLPKQIKINFPKPWRKSSYVNKKKKSLFVVFLYIEYCSKLYKEIFFFSQYALSKTDFIIQPK